MKLLILVSTLVFILSNTAYSYPHIAGEIVIQTRQASYVADEQSVILSNLEKSLGKDSVLSIKEFETDPQAALIRLATDSDMELALKVLSAYPTVEFAEPNFIVYAVGDRKPNLSLPFDSYLANGIPNDLDFSKLWGLNNISQKDSNGQTGTIGVDLNILPVWQRGIVGSRDIVVAVIDSGVDWSHADIASNIYINPGEAGVKATNGIDDDHNGFIDDVHGWNFVNKTNDPTDDMGHGTHCAGTIGGVGNNGIGVAGVNWQVSILPLKFLTDQGSGSVSDAVEAINYARKMKVRIMSNSWGSRAASKLLMKTVQNVEKDGILFVAAAGNDAVNVDKLDYYPATYPFKNMIAVAATDNQGTLADFSNYGLKRVHVSAPGVGIYSTTKNGKYTIMSGTSMATPHVAGLAALLLSEYPNWTDIILKDRIIRTSKRTHPLATSIIAKGRVDASNAINGIFQIPDPAESEWVTKKMLIESEHPSKDNQDLIYAVKVPGAKKIRLHFVKIQTEFNSDRVILEQKDGEVIADLTGEILDFTSDYAIGDTINIRFHMDKSLGSYGFLMDSAQYIP